MKNFIKLIEIYSGSIYKALLFIIYLYFSFSDNYINYNYIFILFIILIIYFLLNFYFIWNFKCNLKELKFYLIIIYIIFWLINIILSILYIKIHIFNKLIHILIFILTIIFFIYINFYFFPKEKSYLEDLILLTLISLIIFILLQSIFYILKLLIYLWNLYWKKKIIFCATNEKYNNIVIKRENITVEPLIYDFKSTKFERDKIKLTPHEFYHINWFKYVDYDFPDNLYGKFFINYDLEEHRHKNLFWILYNINNSLIKFEARDLVMRWDTLYLKFLENFDEIKKMQNIIISKSDFYSFIDVKIYSKWVLEKKDMGELLIWAHHNLNTFFLDDFIRTRNSMIYNYIDLGMIYTEMERKLFTINRGINKSSFINTNEILIYMRNYSINSREYQLLGILLYKLYLFK